MQLNISLKKLILHIYIYNNISNGFISTSLNVLANVTSLKSIIRHFALQSFCINTFLESAPVK